MKNLFAYLKYFIALKNFRWFIIFMYHNCFQFQEIMVCFPLQLLLLFFFSSCCYFTQKRHCFLHSPKDASLWLYNPKCTWVFLKLPTHLIKVLHILQRNYKTNAQLAETHFKIFPQEFPFWHSRNKSD